MTFSDLKLTRQFLNAVEESGYQTPTEIQLKAIPPIMAGQDVVGIAQTGTGKTAAYLLPLLQILKYAQGTEVRCLILVPTKELVVQIEKTLVQLAKFTDLRWVALYGGIGPKTQIERLEKGIDLIVATPGRFLELYVRGIIPCRKIKHIVLDECDRMMDMGFWPQLRQIQEKMPQKKQQLLFSATFPDKVQQIADNFLLFPTKIEVTPQATPAETVEQLVYEVPNLRTKLNLLLYLLKDETMKRVIVFTSTKTDATSIANFLIGHEIGEVRLLHSNKGQNARMNAMDDFKDGEVRVLVSTDVSARGLDIFEVSHVVNFNIPTKYEDYVHRIGRTGRAFKTGTAISFYDISEVYHLRKIEKLIRQFLPKVALPEDLEIIDTGFAEKQKQLREIDHQKKLENPEFKGAFHEKKNIPSDKKVKSDKDKKTGRKKPYRHTSAKKK
jgi:ATP-dependent RNA helicase RhlE